MQAAAGCFAAGHEGEEDISEDVLLLQRFEICLSRPGLAARTMASVFQVSRRDALYQPKRHTENTFVLS